MTDDLSRNERIKEASDYLRGTLTEGLRENHQPDHRRRPALVKFTAYVFAGRSRPAAGRTRKKMEKAFAFMIRVRIPGGVLSQNNVAYTR